MLSLGDDAAGDCSGIKDRRSLGSVWTVEEQKRPMMEALNIPAHIPGLLPGSFHTLSLQTQTFRRTNATLDGF